MTEEIIFTMDDYVGESIIIEFSDNDLIYIIHEGKDITKNVLEWLDNRQLEYDKLTHEDELALCFYIRSL